MNTDIFMLFNLRKSRLKTGLLLSTDQL